MKKAMKVTGIQVLCPHCGEEVEFDINSLGDEWICNWSHCDETFKLPTIHEAIKSITSQYMG